MGRGDKRTTKGKIASKSHGNTRPKKKSETVEAPAKGKVAKKK